ncbi:type II toxin-antitoxin system RelE/ParE family toxin [Methylobacterium sp. WL2]|uniref:type II toxin-antitoxin system RelE/ParE family toxin n=1 Tax=Methylobacterium sp. WL2 TaxID=2603902 RepID=UPI0011C7F5D3|nr:type II toxin-antitoxin system RelE/ParE family toxin [Methylobacterium sp. WL2]TXN50433.1 type II toxin-antitoxin system RelE/ParE family toxin [Methylobacterium sp. WL2]
MPTIQRTAVFRAWVNALRDRAGATRIFARIDRLRIGNPGDVEPVGENVSEMKIDFGPGYRVYYTTRGEEIIVLLCGGDKTTQQDDIAEAKRLAKEI